MEQVQENNEDANEPLTVVTYLRSVYLLLTEKARKQFGQRLEEEQEVLMKLSEIAILLYAAESAVLRTIKKEAGSASLSWRFVETLLEETVSEALIAFRSLERTLLHNDREFAQTLYSKLLAVRFTNSIERNRQIAEALYEKGMYSA